MDGRGTVAHGAAKGCRTELESGKLAEARKRVGVGCHGAQGVHSRSRSWGGDGDTAPEEPSSRKQQAVSPLPPTAPRPASSTNGGSEAGPPAPEDRVIYFHTADGGKVRGRAFAHARDRLCPLPEPRAVCVAEVR